MIRDGLELWLAPSGVILNFQCISSEYMLSVIDHRTKTTLWSQLRRDKPPGVEEDEIEEVMPRGGKPLPKREMQPAQPAQVIKKPKPPVKQQTGLPPQPTRPPPIPEEERPQPKVQMTRDFRYYDEHGNKRPEPILQKEIREIIEEQRQQETASSAAAAARTQK